MWPPISMMLPRWCSPSVPPCQRRWLICQASVPEHAQVPRMPQSTLATREKALIKKRRHLTAGKKGIYWALAKCKKGYSKIDKALRSLLVVAFNDHPSVIVSPNTKDMLQLKNSDGKKVLVPKVFTWVDLRTIFSNIVNNNQTIKKNVGECAFCYIISRLGSIHCFTNSY